MARKLSDAEFVERTRENNRRRSLRQRQRLEQSGRKALTVWIPEALLANLTTKAANDGATIADTAAALLSAALSIPPPPPEPTTLNPAERDARLVRGAGGGGGGDHRLMAGAAGQFHPYRHRRDLWRRLLP